MDETRPPKPRLRPAQAPRKRAPGRPSAAARGPRGGEADVRGELLDAAIACFVRSGIAATSLREIAREAHVTPALLNYYFGDKAQLKNALVEERLMPALARMRAPLEQAGDDPADLIGGFVAGVGQVAAAHPWLPPLWVREVLCEGGALRDVLFEQIGPAIPQMMAQRFAAAQARGQLNLDLDPRLLMVSLVGLTLFPIAGAPIWRRLFAGDPTTAALDLDTLRRHTLALLDSGLQLRESAP
jgi:TetR/AcrR family transcriptional regulator